MSDRPPSEPAPFAERLASAVHRNDSLVCVGLDPELSRFPAALRALDDPREAIVRFNAAIIEATADLVCAYKPNFAFYVAHGLAGLEALVETRRLIPPHIPVILDCKIGDTGNTTAAYARGFFDSWGFDAVTANPYMGEEGLAPLLRYPGRAVIILARTSNPGAGDLQDRPLADDGGSHPLYLAIAERAKRWAEQYPATVGLVVGATTPDQLALIRAAHPDRLILLPGVGAQGGDVEAAVTAGLDPRGAGLLVNSSRGIIYAGGERADFATAARAAAERLRAEINAVRRKVAAGSAR
ncbi:MAG TPA: orotidine-5'-phosphate decarboxylase [Thermomicrobiales bacterium]